MAKTSSSKSATPAAKSATGAAKLTQDDRATVALKDNFAQAFRTSRGKVDPELKLGF